MLAIGGLFFVFSALWKKLKAINYILFFLCSFGPIAFWAYIRYQYDGMAFLGQMFGVDVTQRISDSAGHNTATVFFTKYLLNYLPTLFMIFAIILLLIYLIYNKKIKYSVDMLGFSSMGSCPSDYIRFVTYVLLLVHLPCIYTPYHDYWHPFAKIV